MTPIAPDSRARPSRRLVLALPLALLLAAGLTAPPAHADLSKKVIAAFKGKILVTKDPLEMVGDDKATVAHFKKTALTELKGAAGGDEVWTWQFVYTAFLAKGAGTTSLKLEFYDGKTYSADRVLTGVDPKSTVLAGDIEITEDDGLTKGKSYTLKLVASVKGKDLTLATTQLRMH